MFLYANERGKEMVFGYLALAAAAALYMQKFQIVKRQPAALKLHKCIGILLVILVLFHIINTFSLWDKRNVLLLISGMAAAFLIILMCWRERNRGQKKHRMFAEILLLLLLLHIGLYFMDFIRYKNAVKDLLIEQVEIGKLEDGTYIGECDVGYIYARVKVAVEDGQITGIEILEHKQERGKRAEKVTEQIVEQQTLQVDAVSGATNSSLVIRKAVENAVTNNPQEND